MTSNKNEPLLDISDSSFQQENLRVNSRTIITTMNDLAESHLPAKVVRALSLLSQTTYHTLDFVRIFSVGNALLGQSLHQVFAVLKEYDRAPSEDVQRTWLGFALMGITCSLSLGLKIANYKNREKDSAYEDYFFAIISPAIFFILLDNLNWNSKNGASLISVFCLYPIIAYLTKSLTIPDSSNRSIFSRKEENYPSYRVSLAEKLVNALLTGSVYVAPFQILFWLRNREEYDGTVPMNSTQTMISYAYFLIPIIAAYGLTSRPILFNTVAAVSKMMRDAALTYAAGSGVAHSALVYSYDCDDGARCWPKEMDSELSAFLIFLSVMVGLYSSFFTYFRFEENHKTIKEIAGYLENKVSLLLSYGTGARTDTPPSSYDTFGSFFTTSPSQAIELPSLERELQILSGSSLEN